MQTEDTSQVVINHPLSDTSAILTSITHLESGRQTMLREEEVMKRVPSSEFDEEEKVQQSKNPMDLMAPNEDDEQSDDEEQKEGHELDLNMQDIALMHMAKKNLCFELEYIQTVCQSLEIQVSQQFGQFNQLLVQDQDDPLTAMSEEKVIKKEESKGVRFKEDLPVQTSVNDVAQKKMRIYLETMYTKLNQMKKEVLKDDNKLTRDELKKHLTTMACCLERTRLYLDNYIYPRDLSLNLIDVPIEQSSVALLKKANHLTERLYTIVYKDFFTAYERAVLFNAKIQKFAGKEVEDQYQIRALDTQQVILDQDILEDDRESVQLTSQDLDSNKMSKDADDARKHISRKVGGAGQDMRGMMKIFKNFYPSLTDYTSIDEIMDQELTFILKFKSMLSPNHEVYATLFQENGHPYTLSGTFDQQQAIQQQHEQTFCFVNISLKSIIQNNLALIIKFVEKKRSKSASVSQFLLNTSEQTSTHKLYKGYTILPISKMFWLQQLRVKQVYEIREAQIYKPMNPLQIEDKYATLIDKRGFKKFKDIGLTQFLNLSYQYKLEPKLKEEQIQKSNAMIVRRVNFDSQMLQTNDQDQINLLKSKVEKYRFNDLKIDLNSAIMTEATLKKSPLIRIEIALRDNYGVVYDTIYKTINDNTYNFMQTYESLIYPMDPVVQMYENFFIRIPTKSLDTLKKIYLVFLIQTLVPMKDAKGNKIKSTNFQQDLDTLQFRNEMVAVLPLYDFPENCILKNKTYNLDLYQIDDPKKPIPTKFENFKLLSGSSNLKIPSGDRVSVTVRLISNEFTHNPYINNLLLLKDSNIHQQDIETILKSLKNLKDTNEQILFHDKILDKLFQLMSHNKDPEVADLIFETIIMMIDLFQNRFADYKEILDNYIQKHFAHSSVYLSLLHQIRKMSDRIKIGLIENSQYEEKNSYVLMTMKYLGIILKIVRNSFLEALSCQDSLPDADPSSTLQNVDAENDINYFQTSKYEIYKKSMIEEENEEESDEYDLEDDNNSSFRDSKRSKNVRKSAIRRTQNNTQQINQGMGMQQANFTKRQFGISIQKSLINIFEGCHKDAMKTTLSIRAILYENISNIFENITEFMDDQFLISVLHYLYEENHSMLGVQNNGGGGKKDQKQLSKKTANPESSKAGILKKADETMTMVGKSGKSKNAIMRRSEMQSVGGQMISVVMDYMQEEQNVKALQNYNWINEEGITKLKIISMGKLLASGIFEKVQGDTNKIVMAFCDNIERHHLKRIELNLHVFFYLYQLQQYLKSPDEFAEVDESKNQKLKIFSKSSLDLKDFFTKILPEVSNYLRILLKDANIEDRVKEAKFPDESLKPFKEKASLVFMSVANSVTKERFKYIIFNEPKKLLAVVKTFKKLSNKITFKEPYMIFFEKKKVQVVRKIVEFIISIFMEMEPEHIGSEYFQTIYQCRLMMIYLWNKLAKIKQDFKKTMRSKNLVKDQLKVHKGKMLVTFRAFWNKFKFLGQPWISIKGSMSKQFQTFINLSQDKAIKLYMEVVSDTMAYEYKETKDIFNTSSSIFKVFYVLSNMQQALQANQVVKYDTAKMFYLGFEKMMCESNALFKTDVEFQKLVRQRFQQMKGLSDAIMNVNYSKEQMKENYFYRAYCQAQLIEVLWELKLFTLFLENQESYENLNLKLDNNLEVAYTSLRFVESLEQQTEDDRILIGQREILARIQLTNLQKVQKYFSKAEFYEKAIEILNKQKEIAENMLFDYQLVSNIVKSQYKIYKTLGNDQDRHFAKYFKLGFFGQSFPNMLRNKEFIYRGSRFMNSSGVIEKLQKYFPDVLSLQYSKFPDKEVMLADKKSVQIQRVDPLTYLELKDFDMASKTKDKEELQIGVKAKDLPPKLRTYYLENFKNKFYKQTMLDNNNNNNELQRDRQIEIFKVKNKFPTIFNLQEIIKVKKLVRYAIDEAIRNVQVIIDTIEQLKKTATSTEDASDFEFLTSQIRAALESPIQGGIIKYVQTFVTPQNLKGSQRNKTVTLFDKIEVCDQMINDGIQAIASFTQEETMLTKINGDYKQFKEHIYKVRLEIDSKV